MLRKQWQDYALKAKQIAKHIVTGLEQDKKGVRLIQIVYKLDMYATDALNLKYSKQRSKSSVHTYQGGIQEISTQHADGSEGLFKSNGECQPTNNPMDIEVKEYMNNSKNEAKNMNKKVIRLTENDLHKIVRKSVNKILRESLDSHMMIDDKSRVFDAFKNLLHVMIWENGNVGGDENTLIDAENRYLQEYGERDLGMLWNNIQKYTWDIVDKQSSIGNSM
jgi:hypothetical protein